MADIEDAQADSGGPVRSTEPALSVVVPATNQPPTLARCLAALEPQLAAADELIVVTDAPLPGPASARNAGAASGGGEVLVFVDADVVVRADAVARIREAMSSEGGPDALFGSYDDSPEHPGAVSGFRNLLHHYVHQSAPGAASTFWAGLGAVRREAFERVGGFDEQAYSKPSIEDIELGMRLSQAGAQIVLDPGLQGTHLKRWTFVDMVRTDVLRRGAPWVALLAASRRNDASASPRETPFALNLGWRHRLSALAALGMVLSLAVRRPLVAVSFTLAMLGLNEAFYRLLLRRRGPGQAAAGVGLHLVHHLSAVVAVPIGLAQVRDGGSREDEHLIKRPPGTTET